MTAAAIGAISGAVIVLGRRSVFDLPTALLAAGTLLMLLRFKKLPEPLLIAAAALFGLLLYPFAHR